MRPVRYPAQALRVDEALRDHRVESDVVTANYKQPPVRLSSRTTNDQSASCGRINVNSRRAVRRTFREPASPSATFSTNWSRAGADSAADGSISIVVLLLKA